ncbi:porin [Tardiphaga sp. P9-11]|uniref:porin n=1 Tax=Tardiphaga sp. P9-11 TaxID=2024614 RepID=UPI0011F1881D|nr:porin [Tardiphaga sp. P9-11]KAA0069992.1 porin [Tardiphaga sp. P9-11]
MKNVKRALLLGATTLALAHSAQAADLPVKAKAVEYVKVCSLYGAGFYYIPGTDTCVKIGGQIRVATSFNAGTYNLPYYQSGAGSSELNTKNYFQTRERFGLNVDTRTATEYGVVRTFSAVLFDFAQGRENISGGFAEVDYAFLQFAGFTFGKAVSQFDSQWVLSKPLIGTTGFLSGSFDATGIAQAAYTKEFGNGVSATVALEDGTPYRNAGVYNTANFLIAPGQSTYLGTTFAGVNGTNTFLGNSSGGDHIPEIVGNVRWDQAWGSLHFSAAGHNIQTGYYGSNETTGHPDDTWGYAVSGAFELKTLPTGAGDSLKVEGSFANGAAKYIFGGTYDTAGGGRFAKFSGQSLAFGYVLDGVFSPGGQIQKSDAWNVSAYFEHYWNPNWRTSLFGSYSHVKYNSDANAALFAAFGAGGRLGVNGNGSSGVNAGVLNATGDFSFGVAQIGTRTAWTPVKDLTLAAEFMYTRLDQNLNGTYTGAVAGKAGTAGTPASYQTYQLTDQNIYSGSIQILRSF